MSRYTPTPEDQARMTPSAATVLARSDDAFEFRMHDYIEGDDRAAIATFTYDDEAGSTLDSLIIDLGVRIGAIGFAEFVLGELGVEALERASTEYMEGRTAADAREWKRGDW